MTQDKVPRPPALLMTSPENLTQCSPRSEPNGLQSNSARFVRVIHTIHSHKAYLGKKLRTFAYLPSLRNKIRKETTIKHISKKKREERSHIAAKFYTSFELVEIVFDLKYHTVPF